MKNARVSAARVAMLAFIACGILSACHATSALADARFGDSTWVAPAGMFDAEYTTDGPRVAARDHERRWETVLRTPFRVVFSPLRLLASGLEFAAGYVGPRYFEPKATPPPRSGIAVAPHVEFGALNDIGVGPAITWFRFPTSSGRLDLSGSWSAIDRRTARFSEVIGDRQPVGFRLLGNYDYKPNRHYYGLGNHTSNADVSYFLLATTNAQAMLLFGSSPLRQVRLVGGYSSMSPGRGYHAQPLLELDRRWTTQELWYGVTADLAALDDSRDPSRGIHGRVDLRRASGLRSSDPDYSQWRMEGRAYLPVFAKRRVIAVRTVYTGIEPNGGSETALPFYRLAQSDGVDRFAAYGSGRFRDRQLMLARVEYRWPIIFRICAFGMYELGEVAPNSASFTLGGTHRSYGGGLRFGLSSESVLRLELANGEDGLHTAFSFGGDF